MSDISPNKSDCAVVLFSNVTDPSEAGSSDVQSLIEIDQRVVRVIGRNDGWVDIRFGLTMFRVSERCLRPIEAITFDVGDLVSIGDSQCRIRDVIWHFKDCEPNYYVERDGKKLSKRYRDCDLKPSLT